MNYDSDSSDSTTNLEEDRHDVNRPPELTLIIVEMAQTIDCLYRLSMELRERSSTDRYLKSANIDLSYFEPHDIKHVLEKFPTAKECLVHRIGGAISQRRQYLRYRAEHAIKLAKPVDSDDTATETTGTSFEDHGELDPGGIKRIQRIDSIGFFGSETSKTSSFGVGTRGRMPSMPKSASNRKFFECPYCHTIEIVANTHAWRKHVYKDEQPYLCTFEECKTPNEIYDGRRRWFSHDLANHRRYWTCKEHCQQEFSSRKAFGAQIEEYRPKDLTADQLPAFIDMCGSAVHKTVECLCPPVLYHDFRYAQASATSGSTF